MAGGAAADHDVVLPLGLEAEHVEEGGDAVDLAGGQVQRPADPGDGFLRQEPFGLLDFLENGNESIPATIGESREDRIECRSESIHETFRMEPLRAK